jgi:aspartate racemase
MQMKTIGILGGLGPQATMDFEARLHQVSQRLIPQQGNYGFPPVVVYYVRHAPIIVGEDFKPVFPIQPDPRLLEAAQKLGALSDFMVITANCPHLLQEAIEAASGVKILSMIEVTLDEVRRRGLERVGVLGFGEPLVYQGPLEGMGIAYEILPEERRAQLDEAVIAVWEGRDGEPERELAREAVDWLRARPVDGVILGCTELPLLLSEIERDPDIINPTQLLAEAAVRKAIEDA